MWGDLTARSLLGTGHQKAPANYRFTLKAKGATAATCLDQESLQ